jgi:Fe-Mn family superoxide dismutase
MKTAIDSVDAVLLPALPYAENALEPIISAQTVHVHYAKHHQGYVITSID